MNIVYQYTPVLLDQIIAAGQLGDVVIGYVILLGVLGTAYICYINR